MWKSIKDYWISYWNSLHPKKQKGLETMGLVILVIAVGITLYALIDKIFSLEWYWILLILVVMLAALWLFLNYKVSKSFDEL